MLELVIIVVAISVGAIVKKLGFPIYALYGGMLLILSTITAIILKKMKWWKVIGFRRLDKKSLYLLIIPVIPMIGNLFGSYRSLELGFYIYYLLLTIMSGFVEEGLYRGVMLRVLLQTGAWRAVIITSLIFSLSHIMNALAGWDWQHVVLQLIYSFAIGFGWAAFALKTGTIWPLMIIHFLNNFFSFIKTENLIKTLQTSKPTMEGIVYSMVISIVFIIYGIVVTRSYIRIEKQQ
jgi:membrane protease YdiL (CAAX protease family)